MSKIDWENLTEEEQIAAEKKENKQLRRKSRAIRTAILDKISKDEDSEEFPNLDGSNKQVYALVAVLDGVDRDVQESEKALATADAIGDTGTMVTALFEAMINRAGDPSAIYANGERGMKTVGDNQRLKPENKATDQHMHRGKDEILYEDVFHAEKKKKTE